MGHPGTLRLLPHWMGSQAIRGCRSGSKPSSLHQHCSPGRRYCRHALLVVADAQGRPSVHLSLGFGRDGGPPRNVRRFPLPFQRGWLGRRRSPRYLHRRLRPHRGTRLLLRRVGAAIHPPPYAYSGFCARMLSLGQSHQLLPNPSDARQGGALMGLGFPHRLPLCRHLCLGLCIHLFPHSGDNGHVGS